MRCSIRPFWFPGQVTFRDERGSRAPKAASRQTVLYCASLSQILAAGVHVLIEKPSVLTLSQLDELTALARKHKVLAKVVYHKLLDPDHKKLRTLVADNVLKHVNNGYCSLLEPKQISASQFAEWIQGRNPGTYVAVHYIKLIDFTFGGKLKTITATGQRGLVGPKDGPTWDSTQTRRLAVAA